MKSVLTSGCEGSLDVAAGAEPLKWAWGAPGPRMWVVLSLPTGLVCSEAVEQCWRVTEVEGQGLCLGSGLNER